MRHINGTIERLEEWANGCIAVHYDSVRFCFIPKSQSGHVSVGDSVKVGVNELNQVVSLEVNGQRVQTGLCTTRPFCTSR